MREGRARHGACADHRRGGHAARPGPTCPPDSAGSLSKRRRTKRVCCSHVGDEHFLRRACDRGHTSGGEVDHCLFPAPTRSNSSSKMRLLGASSSGSVKILTALGTDGRGSGGPIQDRGWASDPGWKKRSGGVDGVVDDEVGRLKRKPRRSVASMPSHASSAKRPRTRPSRSRGSSTIARSTSRPPVPATCAAGPRSAGRSSRSGACPTYSIPVARRSRMGSFAPFRTKVEERIPGPGPAARALGGGDCRPARRGGPRSRSPGSM